MILRYIDLFTTLKDLRSEITLNAVKTLSLNIVVKTYLEERYVTGIYSNERKPTALHFKTDFNSFDGSIRKVFHSQYINIGRRWPELSDHKTSSQLNSKHFLVESCKAELNQTSKHAQDSSGDLQKSACLP